ncbi:hypothetical protein [Salinisphaera orenii]|uniref:hypothetical protein n=1 Tax=Salinisphaera orenii TaxID=856731 RepID=UPI0013A65AC4
MEESANFVYFNKGIYMKLYYLTIVFAILMFSGCGTNKFATYYGSYGNNNLANNHDSKQPRIVPTFDFEGKVGMYKSRGYKVLGQSSFRGPWVPRVKAMEHGQDIGADVVVISANYRETVTKNLQITVPRTTTTTVSGTATPGVGDTVNFQGTATTTSYGGGTYNHTYNIHKFGQKAAFLVSDKD